VWRYTSRGQRENTIIVCGWWWGAENKEYIIERNKMETEIEKKNTRI